MDSKVAKWLLEGLRVAAILVPGLVYLERRMAHLELAEALLQERAQVLQARVDRLDSSTSSRLGIGGDGGFGDPTIRAIVNSTIREQTKHYVTRDDLERLRAEQERLIQRIVEANALKPAK